MLSESRVHATLPAVDLERAKHFYSVTLGFRVERENPAAVMFSSAGGTRFTVFATPNSSRAGHTQAGWEVGDIEREVAELTGRGVVFEEYDFPNLKTIDGVAQTGAGRAAWFKDSEGNTLGLIEFPD
jgi:catechol 2,3-dioxygenase-like lactoylglutathione lyase family enzyme